MPERQVTLYSRAGCHLCEVARAVVEEVQREIPLALTVVDIDSDAQLLEEYRLLIPVIVVDDVELAHYRITAAQLRARLLESAS